MQPKQANAILLSAILDKIGLQPAKNNGFELWYCSPFREEKTPNLKVNIEKNTWHDYAEDKSGTAIDFVCAWLAFNKESHTEADAERWLKNMLPMQEGEAVVPTEQPTPTNPNNLKLKSIGNLKNPSLIQYLSSKGISVSLARKYLKEAKVSKKDTRKTILAIAVRNEGEGYELRNKLLKDSITPNDIIFFRGTETLHHEVHVFADFMDFLSALAFQKKKSFDGDAIIVNSFATLSQTLPYIKDYSYKILYSWFGNDASGEKATQALKKFLEDDGRIAFCPMNELYKPYKNVNAWHLHNLKD